ncbi:MAG: ATP-binding protein [Bacteroidales bacterium]|nr:ATP-binding protein [Bacteroidales bacterium]
MLKRKIQLSLKEYFESSMNKVLIIDGARQIGKSYIIRHEGQAFFANFVEINMINDRDGARIFADVKGTEDFYVRLSSFAGRRLGTKKDTLIFLDEIQAYPEMLTLLKFLCDDGRFNYIASGSLLGVTMHKTLSVPGGRIEVQHMYPLDFEEFLWANGVGDDVVAHIRGQFEKKEGLSDGLHRRILDLFKTYLLVGGLPQAVNIYLSSQNIYRVRKIHEEIHNLYSEDASQYSMAEKLKIRRVYDLIPSNMENRKKRLQFNEIEEKKGRAARDYEDEVEYLISAGVSVAVRAISNPVFPLIASARKNLLKLYMNDVGLLSYILFRNNVTAVKDDQLSINLGSLYETVVATELLSHDHPLFYYDNKQKGEVDFMVDDYQTLSILPIEVKSGKDYTIHRALDRFVSNTDYGVKQAVVLSNNASVSQQGTTWHFPIYYVMFL